MNKSVHFWPLFVEFSNSYFGECMNYRLTQRKGRCVQVSYDDGKTWASTGCYTKSEARRKLGAGSLDTLGEYAEKFFVRTDEDSYRYRRSVRGNRLDEHTLNTMQYRLDNLILPVFGKMVVSDIKAKDIEYWFTKLKSPENECYSNSTKNAILNTLRKVLDNAVLDGVVETNVARIVKPYKKRHVKKPAMTLEELELLIPKDDTQLLKNFKNNVFVTAYYCIFKDTGFRPCEIVALKRSDIRDDGFVYTEYMYDFYTKTIEHRIKTAEYGQDYKVGRLTEQTMRIVDMTGSTEYIFYDNRDKFCIGRMDRYFKSVTKRILGREDLAPYSMRHSFMTNIVNKYPKELTMELMGHTVWEDCYDNRSPELKIDGVRKALNRYQEQQNN